MQCGNNVKQMSLAIQNYHDTFMYTPYGVRERTTLNASTGAVTGRNGGPSWLFATLPYCEQKPLYDKMDAQDRAATGNDYRTNNNVALQANNAKIKYMLCPSSPLPETDSVSGRIFTRNPARRDQRRFCGQLWRALRDSPQYLYRWALRQFGQQWPHFRRRDVDDQ